MSTFLNQDGAAGTAWGNVSGISGAIELAEARAAVVAAFKARKAADRKRARLKIKNAPKPVAPPAPVIPLWLQERTPEFIVLRDQMRDAALALPTADEFLGLEEPFKPFSMN